jgi:hypothetical protein
LEITESGKNNDNKKSKPEIKINMKYGKKIVGF